ncbi:MAG: ABC transporter permease [Chloroflexi bacterium]|nr:ABC transporter permease [Chloroflexota bacterium]
MQSVSTIPQAQQRPRVYWMLSDTWELFKRSVIQIRRTPDQVIAGVILQPIFLIITFRYVIGGAIMTGEANYVDFLMPGMLVTNVIQLAAVTLVSIPNDMTSGIVDRFRSLPMEKSAILGGTVLSVAVRCVLGVATMIGVGLLVGFRPQADVAGWLTAVGLLLLVSYAFAWLLAVFGLMAQSVEGAQQMGGFVWPLYFLSSAFVPVESMPPVLRAFANNQPLTPTINAVRALLLDQPVGNHVWITVAWCTGIILVSVPLTGILFRRRFS